MEEIKKGGLTLFGGALAVKLGGAVFKFISMNQLPPEVYGKLAIFLVLFNWLLLISTVNMTLGLSKKISGEKDENYYKASLIGCGVISVGISIGVLLLSAAISSFLSIQNPLIVVLLGLTIPLSVLYYLKIYHFRGHSEMVNSVASDGSLTAVRIGLLILLFYLGFQLSPYFAFLLSFLALDLYFLLSGSFKLDIQLSSAFRYFKKLLVYSFPIFVAESLRFFGLGLDRLFLAKFFGTASTGIYDIGVSLCLGYVVIATSFGNALLPSASRSEEDKGKLREGLGKALLYVLGLYLVYTFLLSIFSKPLINFVNPEYLPLTQFLLPLALAYSLIGVFTLLIFFLSGIGLQRWAAYSSGAFVVLAAAGNYFLVPQLKFLGAIYALWVASIGALLLLVYPVCAKALS